MLTDQEIELIAEKIVEKLRGTETPDDLTPEEDQALAMLAHDTNQQRDKRERLRRATAE